MGAEGSEEPQKGEDDDSFDAFWHPESGGHQQPAKTAAQQPRRSPPTCINAQQKQPLSPSPDHPTTSTSNGGSPPAKRMRRTRSGARLIIEQPKSSSGISGFPALLQKSQLQILIRIRTVHREFDPLNGTVLRLRGEPVGSGSRTSRPDLVAILRDSWFLTPVKKGNTLRLIEPRRKSENVFEVDDTQGLAILEPDTLISGTAFSQAMYCPRKALFADRFRASGSNLAMTVGTIAHELFQIALTKRPSDLSAKSLFGLWRRRFLPSVCLDLIGMQCSLERFEEELRPYLDNIARWIKIHTPSTNPQSQQQKPIAHIRKINSEIEQDNNILTELDPEPVYFAATRDIEENVWMPTLGIKGRIDVSFMASSKLSNTQVSSEQSPMVMPLELKTGKSYGTVASIEHHSQVLMYTMMLAERANGGRVGPGFLLYLRDNALVEVQPKTLQLRGLLQMRNRIAVHFARFTLDSFPEPLKEPRMCRFCPYTTLCGALLNNKIDEDREAETGEEEEIICLGTPEKKLTTRTEIDMDDKENIPPTNTDQSPVVLNRHSVQEEGQFVLSPEMRVFLDDAMTHLRPAEIVYALQWIRRTLEEWDAANQKGSTKRLFSQSPAEREKLGTCMTNMELVKVSTATPNDADWALEETFLLQFRKTNGFCKSAKISLEPGSVVTVSTDHSFALLIATVDSIDSLDFIITLRSDKCLPVDPKTPSTKPLYHLDKHDGFSAFALRLGAIGTLLENSPPATKLRSILATGHANLDGTEPSAICSTTALKYIGTILQQDHQQQQLLRALNTPDYAIIKGPDKKETSSFLVAFATLLLRQQKSVLFCANSNATVDELLLQLVAKGLPRDQLLRIGASKALHPDAVILSLDNKLETDLELLKTDTEAKAYYCRVQALIEKKPLFVTSTLSSVSSHAFFVASGHFDFCLIDDPFGSLADSTLIAPLLRSDRFVLFTTAKAVKTQPENLIARLESMMIAAGDSSRLITLQTENLGPEKLEDGGAEKTHSTPKTVEKKQTKQRPKIKKTLFDFWCQKPKSTKK